MGHYAPIRWPTDSKIFKIGPPLHGPIGPPLYVLTIWYCIATLHCIKSLSVTISAKNCLTSKHYHISQCTTVAFVYHSQLL